MASSDPTYPTQAQTRKRESSPSFLIPADRLERPDMLTFQFEHGLAGVGIWFLLITKLRRADNFVLAHKQLPVLARAFQCELPLLESVIQSLVTEGIFGSDLTHFWYPELTEDMALFAHKKEVRSVAGRASARRKVLLKQQKNFVATNQDKDTDKDTDKDLDKDLLKGGYGGKTTARKKQERIEKVKHLNYVWLTAKEYSDFVAKHGQEFIERCIEKLDATIEKNPTPDRIKNGMNAAATFRAWVVTAVTEEFAKLSRANSFSSPQAVKGVTAAGLSPAFEWNMKMREKLLKESQ